MFLTKKKKKKWIKKRKLHAFKLPIKYSIYWCLPLLLHNHKLAQVATWLTSRYSYGKTLLWDLFSKVGVGGVGWVLAAAQDQSHHPKPQPDAKPDQLHGRKEADGQQSLSTTRLYWRDRSKPHSLLYTRKPSTAVLLHMCSFSYRWKLKLSNPPKLTAKCEVGGL